MHFNPRPREEGDSDLDISDIASSLISIHALVKRATPTLKISAIVIAISIHALVKRATDEDGWAYEIISISIHALVKRATSACKCF